MIEIPRDQMILSDDEYINSINNKSANHIASIVVYSDSMKCTSCYIKGLAAWNEYLGIEDDLNAEFVFIVSPKREKQKV